MSRAGCPGARWPCRRHRTRGCWISGATAARRAALQILDAVRSGATCQSARERALPTLAERDRRLAYELAAGVLRRRSQLDHVLSLATADPRLHDILRLGAYQLRALQRVPVYAAVSTSVELAREAAGDGGARYVNQALRRLARTGSGERGAVPSHPTWLVARWTKRFGAEETARLTAWNDTKPALTLQPAAWSLDELRARLTAAGFGVREAPYGAGVRVTAEGTAPRSPLPSRLPGFAEGAFVVQDPAHALVCRYAGIPAGTLVYDACAAPGGKSVTLERGGARVVAGEAQALRMPRLVETARRAGVAIRVAVADLLAAPFRPGAFGAVLVDAPCSATGTLARHPDARWRIASRTIVRAAERQGVLLAAAATLVGPSGVLVYATCSLESEENDDVVTAFLDRRPDFTRAPVAGAVPADLLTPAGDFQALPQRHGTDGAYAARLVRVR
ncbi:MAG TPA: transcription antitermination factor NusB [Gemmatimonadales bacterium]|nr:transcription antitermination factor NusB [Gemmatimonadales bacterium]